MDAVSSSTSTSSSVQQSPSIQMVPQPAPTQSSASTNMFLQDFTLIAEAAKRAQMAIMIRDFEDCGL
ncbi:thiol methyltransferase [Fusarium heterosporum]|uniref:Thiol methyltransferase n=1 Tax=Fusarium heterosporum TaxID=42747 RepID=A0A8H5WPZ3_FUSHE|nr:thiol methyltransferase [Fusarium heterosporum]